MSRSPFPAGNYHYMSVITYSSTRILSQDLVSGLDGVMFNDLMENIEWFFNLHDKNKDGHLTKDEVLTACESLLVWFIKYLGIVLFHDHVKSSSSVSKWATRIWEPSADL